MSDRIPPSPTEVKSAVEALAVIFGGGGDSEAGVQPKTGSRCPFAQMFGRTTAASLADRLKESTKELHHAAEHHPLQQSIVRGVISRSDYSAFAVAMRQVHASMEMALCALATSDARVAAIFHSRHRRLAAFDCDIALLGGSEMGVTDARAADWLGGADHNHPLAWIGVLYVVEGSSNGGQAIARVLRRAWSLGDETLKSLDPHGTNTRPFWAEFRAVLDAQAFSAAEQDAIVAGAAATFAGITRLMDSLVALPAAAASA